MYYGVRDASTTLLLGHAGNTRVCPVTGRVVPFATPGQLPVTRRVAKLAARDGRWLAAMIRSLTLTDMHMQMCVFNSLGAKSSPSSSSSFPVPSPSSPSVGAAGAGGAGRAGAGSVAGAGAGEVPTSSSPGAVFCAAAGTMLSLVMAEWIDAGCVAPKAHATTWWQALALLSECLISWCCGAHWVAVAAGSAAAPPAPQQRAARTALLCGVACGAGGGGGGDKGIGAGEGGGVGGSSSSSGGDASSSPPAPRHGWGCAAAAAAPALLSLLASAHVPEQAVDSVSGCMFLLARLISSAAEGTDRGDTAGKGRSVFSHTRVCTSLDLRRHH